MSTFNLKYKPFGKSAILIDWPQEISNDILEDIRLFSEKIEEHNFSEVMELNFVYSSLLVIYSNSLISYKDMKKKLSILYSRKHTTIHRHHALWEIPVCYDKKFGIDLDFLSKKKDLDIDKIISLHSSPIYTVFGIGFLPGFLYLGGLPNELHVPRRSQPRLNVPKGAIAIGGNQTGIYPQDTPGGWHILGKTPVSLFDARNEKPCFVSPGDKIKFKPIKKAEYDLIQIAEESEVYQLKQEIYD